MPGGWPSFRHVLTFHPTARRIFDAISGHDSAIGEPAVSRLRADVFVVAAYALNTGVDHRRDNGASHLRPFCRLSSRA